MTTLRQLAEAATPGPWQVITDEHPHYHGGTHKERRIFTVWHHPQLKGPWGIVNNSVGIGAKEGGPARHMVSIEEKNAAYIAAANPAAILALLDTIDTQKLLRNKDEEFLKRILKRNDFLEVTIEAQRKLLERAQAARTYCKRLSLHNDITAHLEATK